MSGIVELFLFAALNYLLGSIPFSFLVARAKGIDPRQVGSGNVGATNVARSVGIFYGVIALLLDIAKGVFSLLITSYFSQPIWISGFAVAGHNWSLFLGFKAGKGVATTLGVLLAISWQAALITAAIWGGLTWLTRYVSIGSVIALLSAPVTLWLLGNSPEAMGLMAVLALISIFQHRENFKRILRGVEGKIR